MTYEEALKWAKTQDPAEPGSKEEKDGMERLREFFSDVTVASVRDKTRSVYAPKCFFNDTLKTLDSAKAVEDYFARTARFLDSFRVIFTDAAKSGTDHYLRWEMELRLKYLKKNKDFLSHGMSHVRLDRSGRLILHQDFWDSAGNLFRHIPILGSGIALIKRMA